MMWHRFSPSSEDDSSCTNPGCGVVVCDDALDVYSNDCPAPSCAAPTNDGTCVFVRSRQGSECAYCDRPGCKDMGGDDDDGDLAEMLEGLDVPEAALI